MEKSGLICLAQCRVRPSASGSRRGPEARVFEDVLLGRGEGGGEEGKRELEGEGREGREVTIAHVLNRLRQWGLAGLTEFEGRGRDSEAAVCAPRLGRGEMRSRRAMARRTRRRLPGNFARRILCRDFSLSLLRVSPGGWGGLPFIQLGLGG